MIGDPTSKRYVIVYSSNVLIYTNVHSDEGWGIKSRENFISQSGTSGSESESQTGNWLSFDSTARFNSRSLPDLTITELKLPPVPSPSPFQASAFHYFYRVPSQFWFSSSDFEIFSLRFPSQFGKERKRQINEKRNLSIKSTDISLAVMNPRLSPTCPPFSKWSVALLFSLQNMELNWK